MGNEKSIVDTKTQYSQEGQFLQATSSNYGYEDKGRWVVENGVRRWHVGPGLIQSNEALLRNPQTGEIVKEYNLATDPGVYLAGLTPSKRVAAMNLLAQAGFLDSGSIGNYNAELSAITNAMELANFAGLEWSNAVNKRLAEGPVRPGGSGQTRTYKKTSVDDLKKIANTVAQNTLGRELTADETARFAEAYNQQEIAYQRSLYAGGTVTDVPSIDVAAETFSQQNAPREAAGYKYLGYMNKLFDSIGI